MDERSKWDLPYGHFGRNDYDFEERRWRFERSLTAGQLFLPHELPEATRQGNDLHQISKPRDPPKEPPSKRYPKQIKSLIGSFPELQPASDILPSLLKVSEAVEEAVRNHDPLRGDLISFAQIRSATSHKPVQLAAYACGETGCDVRVVQVLHQRRGLGDDKDSWLDVPLLSGESATLTGVAGPVQQVKFGDSLQSMNAFLAVRRLERIDIYQPAFTGAVSSSGDGSAIQLDHLYCLSTHHFLLQQCADVAFNPWFPQHVGIVDCDGNWHVCEFANRRLERIARSWSKPTDGVTTESDLTDGWARIAWVGNLETLVVCTRATLEVFTVAEQNAVTGQRVDVQDGGAQPIWILDIKPIPGHEEYFCLLTTQSIIVYHVKCPTPLSTSCEVKLKIRHFRNSEDLGLQVTMWEESDTMCLLLHSSAQSQASLYRLRAPDFDHLVAEDPMVIASADQRHQRHDRLAHGLHVHPLHASTKQSSRNSRANTPTIPAKAASFYSLTTLRDDFSISQRLWRSVSLTEQRTERHLQGFIWTQEPRTTRPKLLKEEFVMDDDDTSAVYFEPTARRTRRKNQPNPGDATIDLELIAQELSNTTSDIYSIADVAAEMGEALSKAVSSDTLPLRTLHAFAKAEMAIGDVEHASRLLEDKLVVPVHGADVEERDDDEESGVRYGISDVHLPRMTGLDEELAGASLSSVYDLIVSKWISPLPPQVSGWVRLAKVSMARQVAAEIVLATRVICVQEREKKRHEPEALPSSQTWNLPMRSSGLESSQQFPSSPPEYRHERKVSTLPTPSPTATPSVITASTHFSNFAAPELYRLSKYTTFTKPSPSVLPRSLKNVLSHWKEGEDLEEYDWMATSRHLSHQEEDEDEGMTEKERKRVQRRAERHIRRQRKEAAASQAQQLASSQAAEVFSASQPAGIIGSSQSQAPSAFVASQVVPGRFGGRPPPKKKRKQGF